MSFKPVKLGKATDIKKEEIGISYVGKFRGSKIIQTPLGEQVIWKFTTDGGKIMEIFGFTNLNMQMENVPLGALCRITYTGKAQVRNKFGKFPHRAKVEVDTDESPEEVENVEL